MSSRLASALPRGATGGREKLRRPALRLYLITPAIEHASRFGSDLASALDAAEVAAVLLRLAGQDEERRCTAIAALAPIIQTRGTALLLDGMSQLAEHTGADGAHITGIATLKSSIGMLKPQRIVGAGGLKTRHDAMIAGESGSDYVMFGEPDSVGQRPAPTAIVDRVAWWAELFELPCIGYAGTLDEIAPLAAAGADFVALGEFVWTSKPAAALAAAAAAIRFAETLQ